MAPPDYSLELRFNSTSVLPFPAPEGSEIPWGIRMLPGARLNVKDFFLDFRLEGGAAYNGVSPIGANYFFSQPSGAMSDAGSGGAWVNRPDDPESPMRGNFGVNSLSAGFRFARDFQIRFGRFRYEQTEGELTTTANTFIGQSNYANVTIPLHWLGGEFRWDRRREDGAVRRLLLSAAAMNGADETAMGVFQGMITLGLGEGSAAPRLSLHAHGEVRSNPQNEDRTLTDTGLTHGEGLGIYFDYDWFQAGYNFNYRFGSSHESLRLENTDERHQNTLFVDFHPDRWRFRGAISFLNQAQAHDAGLHPATARTETHTEIYAGYHPVDGLLLAVGYRGIYGDEGGTHMGFLGIRTSFNGVIPLGE